MIYNLFGFFRKHSGQKSCFFNNHFYGFGDGEVLFLYFIEKMFLSKKVWHKLYDISLIIFRYYTDEEDEKEMELDEEVDPEELEESLKTSMGTMAMPKKVNLHLCSCTTWITLFLLLFQRSGCFWAFATSGEFVLFPRTIIPCSKSGKKRHSKERTFFSGWVLKNVGKETKNFPKTSKKKQKTNRKNNKKLFSSKTKKKKRKQEIHVLLFLLVLRAIFFFGWSENKSGPYMYEIIIYILIAKNWKILIAS